MITSSTHQAKISELFPAELIVQPEYDPLITGMSLDSRSIQKDHLFVARIGVKLDGREFIDEAIANGASVVLSEVEEEADLDFYLHQTGCPIYTHNKVADVLGDIAAKFYQTNHLGVKLIGITGTNGKTSSCQYLAQALQLAGFKVAVLGTNGNGFLPKLEMSGMTTQDVLSCHKKITELSTCGAEFICMEVSSHSLDQQRVAGLNFECAIFTNLSQDHLDYHQDMKAYLAAKQRLFHLPNLKYSVINALGVGASILDGMHQDQAFSDMGRSNSDLQDLQFIQMDESLNISFVYKGDRFEIKNSHLMGGFNAENLALCFLTLCHFDIQPQEVCELLAQVKPALGRMQKINKSHLVPTVYVDFAHTPDALEKSLQAVNALNKEQVIVVFGCGGNKDKAKRSLMAGAAESLADIIIITSDNPRSESQADITQDILSGLQNMLGKIILVEEDRKLAIKKAINLAGVNDVVLIAGKGHEETQELADKIIPFSDAKIALEILDLFGSQAKEKGGLQ